MSRTYLRIYTMKYTLPELPESTSSYIRLWTRYNFSFGVPTESLLLRSFVLYVFVTLPSYKLFVTWSHFIDPSNPSLL